MAHRKLQQEIDRVFKKINEGLEIFDMYYERHENCINNPSQKDKLESDLKREVKKLQRLREQIKSWQSSPEVKDKDALLNYRRSVEVAMEKYKAVEKASKEKAYSNISLKRSDVLDPQEKERREVEDFLSQQIEELERQFDLLEIEVDRLILLQKKRKTATPENEKELQRLKDLQGRYRYHQQQMELALRLIANEELEPQQVRDIEEEILYFVEENQTEGFIEDDSMYEGLDLQSNEAIAHEVAAAFASRAAGDVSGDDVEGKDGKLSKKEQRRLEREAKKNAKAAAKSSVLDVNPTPVITGKKISEASSDADESESNAHTSVPETQTPPPSSKSVSLSPPVTAGSVEPPLPNTASTTAPSKPHTPLSKLATLSSSTGAQTANNETQPHGFTHIHQSLNGLTTTTLKPAPVKPVSENKWALATEKKLASLKAKSLGSVPMTPTMSASSSSAAANSTGLPALSNTPNSSNVKLNESALSKQNYTKPVPSDLTNNNNNKQSSTSGSEPDLIEDDYEIESTDDELENEPVPVEISKEELASKSELLNNVQNNLCADLELLTLPAGIKDFVMGSVISKDKLYKNDGKLGGYRRFYDLCQPCRLNEIPSTVFPPQPLDVARCVQQWDQTLLSLNVDELTLANVAKKFEGLETFTLFYYYYFSILPLEQRICGLLLRNRDWKLLTSGDCWFLRQGEPKFVNEFFEIADYKIFKMDIWTVVDKLNFKLDYSVIAKEEPFAELSEQDNAGNVPTFGKQLLETLKQRKAEEKP
ncbi:general negative regulator of transcription subunit 3 [Kluyveromyces marxianus]|uniref:General negative regulator of transcription subunit n=1 Tax=Kluyveromyces marxianus TaxID=4911 RepID=A0ABX6ET88_KLUMA|nr:general negative regulator of transcription subunit 3 [Kluyveromyces marxianus]BAP70508.1 general negative regulator of transcription subunit 3 [Kluyveromyces marxianus]